MTLLVVVVLVALGFDFTNGFHDTANAVATSVSTRALSPRLAVAIAAVANLAGAFVTTAVAKTVGERDHRHRPRHADDRARRAVRRHRVESAHLVAGPAVELVARAHRRARRRRDRPVGHGRRAVARARAQGHPPGHLVARRSALLGAFAVLLAIYWLFVWSTPGLANRGFRLGQLGSGTWVAFTHGANDAQKTMGVITLALVASGHQATSTTSRPG